MFNFLKKLWQRMFHSMEKALHNSIIDGEILVNESKKKLNSVKSNLIELQTSTVEMEKTIELETGKISNYERMAKSAVNNNDDVNAKLILQKKYFSEYKIKTLSAEIEKNKLIESKLENEIDMMSTKILKVEFELSRLKIQINSNKARSSIIKENTNISSDSINSIMEEIKNLNIKTEAECVVMEKHRDKEEAYSEEKDFRDSMDMSIEAELKKLKKSK